jgi:type I restriction enzyme S subunit
VNGGIFDPNENKLLADDVDPPSDLEVKVGDVLMSRASGSSELIGSVAQVREQPSARLFLSDKTFRVQVKESSFDAAFFVVAMGSSFLRNQLLQIISGAEGLAKNVAQSDIREFQMPFPSLTEQRAIVTHLNTETVKFDTLTTEAQRAIDLLQERRTALISAAVTGQIDVRQVLNSPAATKN